MSPNISSDTPGWVEEVRKEIHRLNNKIARMQGLADRDEMTSEHYEDLDNWTGWRDALRWVLRMREGKATRQDAWGRS
jgi:hypothetical protein